MIARADLPTGTCGAGGARVCSRGGCCARRRRRNVLNPRIQCVLTQWMSSFITFRPGASRSGRALRRRIPAAGLGNGW